MNSAEISSERLTARLAFSQIRPFNTAAAEAMLAVAGSEERFFAMSESELAALTGRRLPVFGEKYRRELFERASRETEYIEANRIRFRYFLDEDYPPALRNCDDAPLALFTLGDAPVDSPTALMLSIVGTRHATAYGVDMTTRLVADIAREVSRPVCIVSGLAYGIDIAAHRAALDNGLPTVAVVAHGLNTIYPADHRSTAVRMVRNGGMLMTEYTSADPVHKGNFLQRNRIVAGISPATVVIESAAKGGALVTARTAFAYGREVFAVPGRTIDRYSEGCNSLIAANNATLLTDADQLIDALRWPRREPTDVVSEPSLPLLSEEEQAVVDHLGANPDIQINDLAVAVGIPAGRLNAILLDMEFRSILIRRPGGKYTLVNH
ncbi:MAG: DNA-processing protein DprA [Clostridium sp.]|nr:DNA-processing protein DprA [Clostridium sp.]